MEYDRFAALIEKVMEKIFGAAETLLVNDTWWILNVTERIRCQVWRVVRLDAFFNFLKLTGRLDVGEINDEK